MSELSERVEKRIRAEWPGTHFFDIHGESFIPPVRDGGATDAIIKFMSQVIEEEEKK